MLMTLAILVAAAIGQPSSAHALGPEITFFVQDAWIVWLEEGGFGLTRSRIALGQQINPATDGPVLSVLPGSRFGTDLCAGSKAFLAGGAKPELNGIDTEMAAARIGQRPFLSLRCSAS